MDADERKKVESIIHARKVAHGYFAKRSDVYQAFLDLEARAFKDGALGKGQKELIATAISVVMNCESCMEWHIREALESGVKEAEILDAIGVGIEMGGGRASVSARFAASVLRYYDERATAGQ